MIKKLAVTISAVAFVMLAIALAPNVRAALATARLTTTQDDAKSKQPLAESCAAFEVWFLDLFADNKRTPALRSGDL